MAIPKEKILGLLKEYWPALLGGGLFAASKGINAMGEGPALERDKALVRLHNVSSPKVLTQELLKLIASTEAKVGRDIDVHDVSKLPYEQLVEVADQIGMEPLDLLQTSYYNPMAWASPPVEAGNPKVFIGPGVSKAAFLHELGHLLNPGEVEAGDHTMARETGAWIGAAKMAPGIVPRKQLDATMDAALSTYEQGAKAEKIFEVGNMVGLLGALSTLYGIAKFLKK